MHLLLLFITSAQAQGYSLDFELIHPSFSPGALPGIDSGMRGTAGDLRFGTYLQFEKDPLVLFLDTEEDGAVVANRIAFDLGMAYDISRKFGIRLVVPGAASFGGELPELGGDGGGIGDLRGGIRLHLSDPGPVAIGLRADLIMPTGFKESYLGEPGVRFTGGLLGTVHLGKLDILADVGVSARASVPTEETLVAGSELDTRLGVRANLMKDGMLGLYGGVLGRGAFNSLYQGGGGNSAEVLAGLQIHPQDPVQLDLTFGKGIADGYGSTDFRMLAGFTYTLPTREEPEPEVLDLPDPRDREPVTVEDDDIDILPEPQPELPKVQWQEGELARVQEKEIIIRDQIQFAVGTAEILPESLPLLKEVARLMNENGQIGFLLVEGHASQEGSFEDNYGLSNLRARSVWQALIDLGVHPARVGYRGMGEVQPLVAGDTPEAQATNRRVVFSIVRMYQPGDTIPELSTEIHLPWNGETRRINPPRLPESYTRPKDPPPQPPPSNNNKGVPDSNTFRGEDEDDLVVPDNKPDGDDNK
jgi:outer membrane protein OmpA-like peptidoglycan-associated protein